MSKIKTISINEGTTLHCYSDSNFKTMRISVNMLIPITAENAALNGILPDLVSRASREYPDYTKLGQRLSQLYGAYIDSAVSNLGGYQVLSVSIGGIAGRYAFGGENMEKELTTLLFSILFNPLLDSDGLFPEDGFNQEKRQILETFDTEFNDKIFYAHRRALETLYGDSPAGINRYGTREDVEKLDRREVTKAWNKLLSEAQFEIFTMGDCKPSVSDFEKAFENYGVSYHNKIENMKSDKIKDITEEMPLAQSKLVLGYKSCMKPDETYKYKLMSAILGGTPSAKLFLNVREKMSLCYYCSSSIDSSTGVMTVESGVETENIEKTKAAILEQLEEMRQGNITDEEILHAKLAVSNVYRSVSDSLNAMEGWYLQRALRDKLDSPEDGIKAIESITREEIIEAANSLVLDTVYVLKGTHS